MTAALPFYVVIDGDNDIIARAVSDSTYAETVKDIASGEISDMTRVIEVGTGRDVTDIIARAVMQTWAEGDELLTRYQREFIESHIGLAAARAFRRVA